NPAFARKSAGFPCRAAASSNQRTGIEPFDSLRSLRAGSAPIGQIHSTPLRSAQDRLRVCPYPVVFRRRASEALLRRLRQRISLQHLVACAFVAEMTADELNLPHGKGEG